MHEYDVIGHPQCDFHFAVTFPWHPGPGGGSVTLLREYAQVRVGTAVQGRQIMADHQHFVIGRS